MEQQLIPLEKGKSWVGGRLGGGGVITESVTGHKNLAILKG